MSSRQYSIAGVVKHGKDEFHASGAIGADGSTTLYIIEQGKGAPRKFRSTVTFKSAVTEGNVSRLLQQQLASQLGRSVKTVTVTEVTLFRPSDLVGTSGASYNVSCQFTRDNKSYLATGKVVGDTLSFALHGFSPHPNGAGGGSYGKAVLADALQLQRDVQDAQFADHAQDLLRRRVARYLRCAPRLVSAAHFRMGREITDEDRRKRAGSPRGVQGKRWRR